MHFSACPSSSYFWLTILIYILYHSRSVVPATYLPSRPFTHFSCFLATPSFQALPLIPFSLTLSLISVSSGGGAHCEERQCCAASIPHQGPGSLPRLTSLLLHARLYPFPSSSILMRPSFPILFLVNTYLLYNSQILLLTHSNTVCTVPGTWSRPPCYSSRPLTAVFYCSSSLPPTSRCSQKCEHSLKNRNQSDLESRLNRTQDPTPLSVPIHRQRIS
jgi:hypothetical protein